MTKTILKATQEYIVDLAGGDMAELMERLKKTPELQEIIVESTRARKAGQS